MKEKTGKVMSAAISGCFDFGGPENGRFSKILFSFPFRSFSRQPKVGFRSKWMTLLILRNTNDAILPFCIPHISFRQK